MRCEQCNREFTERGFNRHRCIVASDPARSIHTASNSIVPDSVEPVSNGPIPAAPDSAMSIPAAPDPTDPVPAAPDPTDPVPAGPDIVELVPLAPDIAEPVTPHPIMFLWNDKPGNQFKAELETAYERIVFFKQNLFKLPSGSAGKDFIRDW